MNKKITSFLMIIIIAFVMVVVLTLDSSNGHYSAYASSGASPGGKTGSPGDVNNCNQCHSGALNPGSATVSLSSAALASGYVPGQTYTIDASISGTTSSKIGFEVTAERDFNNAKVGTIVITDASRTKTVNGGNSVTHNSLAGTSSTGGSNSWSFDWVAPSVGTGSVTFYGNFNATNANGSTSGDQVYTKSFTVSENISTNIIEASNDFSVKLYPNPSSNYVKIESNLDINKVEVLTLDGRKVMDVSTLNKIDIRSLKDGIYLIKLTTENVEYIDKIIKH